MLLDSYCTRLNGQVRISAEQGSRFAKEIAGDFNPIHDPDAKRFCVPGDLLFSLVLDCYGLSRRMSFSFTGMLGADVNLCFPDHDASTFEIGDVSDRIYLKVVREGTSIRDASLLEHFTRRYVAFSGQTFPNVLVPLMRRHGVMINPDRPLVVYEGMSFDLRHMDFHDPVLELEDASLEVSGKRGDVRLHFAIHAGGEPVGTGAKALVLSGLRPYEERRMNTLVAQYAGWKTAYVVRGDEMQETRDERKPGA